MSYMLTTAENELGVVIATSDAGTTTCYCPLNSNTKMQFVCIEFLFRIVRIHTKNGLVLWSTCI